jgi:type VI secretion system protein ImpH
MASPQRKPDDALRQRLGQDGTRFSFFPAAYLLHRLSPNAIPVGELGPVADEAIRFRHDHRLIFHAGDVSSIRIVERNGRALPVELTAAFLGLTGSVSPLSSAMLEEVLRAESSDAPALNAFYDLFHHRVASLFYRAWKKYRFAAGFRLAGDDPYTRRALSFIGIDSAGAIADSGLTPLSQLALAPLLALRVRSGRSLELVLRHALKSIVPDAKVWVEPFVVRKVEIAPEQRVRLGLSNTTLSTDLTIGESVLDQSGRFRVHVAPVSHEMCESLLPGGRHYPFLRNVIEHFSRGHLEAELEVEVSGANTGFCLGSARSSSLAVTTRLGAESEALRMRVLLSENLAEAKPYAVRSNAA